MALLLPEPQLSASARLGGKRYRHWLKLLEYYYSKISLPEAQFFLRLKPIETVPKDTTLWVPYLQMLATRKAVKAVPTSTDQDGLMVSRQHRCLGGPRTGWTFLQAHCPKRSGYGFILYYSGGERAALLTPPRQRVT